MTVTISHVLIGVAVSVLVLAITLYLAWRSTRTVFPVRCVHCWVKEERETIVAYAPQPNQWAICPECVHCYWEVDAPNASVDAPPRSRPEGSLDTELAELPDRAGFPNTSIER
jgi:hypothetical protein